MAYGMFAPEAPAALDPMMIAALAARGLKPPTLLDPSTVGSGPSVAEAPSAGNLPVAPMTNAGVGALARANGDRNFGAMIPGALQGGMFAGNDSGLPNGSGIRDALVNNARLASQQPKHHKPDWGQILATALFAMGDSYRTVNGGQSMMPEFVRAQAERRKTREAKEQTQSYVNALIANGMDPNMAVIIAADPQEMAKHMGTRFDAATVDEGSSRVVPNLSGSANVFTAPKTFQHGADVVQMPGSQSVAPQPGGLATAIPQSLGDPRNIPGLRPEAEQYADSIAQRGTPQWNGAVQDYTLKDHGPTAFGFNQQLQAARLSNARDIASGHDSASRYRTDHPAPRRSATAQSRPPTPQTVIGAIMDKQAAGQPLTAAEQATLKEYRTHYKPQRGAVQVSPNEPMAHGPKGERLVVRNGVWVDSATGQPVK